MELSQWQSTAPDDFWFEATLDHSNGADYGLSFVFTPGQHERLEIGEILPHGLVERWNLRHPTLRICEGDLVVEVSGFTGTHRMQEELSKHEILFLILQRRVYDNVSPETRRFRSLVASLTQEHTQMRRQLRAAERANVDLLQRSQSSSQVEHTRRLSIASDVGSASFSATSFDASVVQRNNSFESGQTQALLREQAPHDSREPAQDQKAVASKQPATDTLKREHSPRVLGASASRTPNPPRTLSPPRHDPVEWDDPMLSDPLDANGLRGGGLGRGGSKLPKLVVGDSATTEPVADGSMPLSMSAQESLNAFNSSDDLDAALVPSASDYIPVDRWAYLFTLARDVLLHSKNVTPLQALAPELAPVWSMSQDYTKSRLFSMYLDAADKSKMKNMRRSGSTLAPRAGDFIKDEDWKGSWMISPNKAPRMAWNLTGGAFVMYDMVMIPMQVFDIPQTLALDVMLYMTLIYWVVDIPLNFITGFQFEGRVEMRMVHTARNYLRTWLVPDVFVVALDVILLIILAYTPEDVSGDTAGTGLLRVGRFGKFLRLLRMVRLMRVFKLGDVLTVVFDVVLQSPAAVILGQLSQNVVALFVLNHYICCAWYGVAEGFKLDASQGWNWVIANGLDASNPESSVLYSYTVSLHWSLTQFSPATNNIVPVNFVERSFAVVVVIFALVFFGYFLGRMTSLLTQLQNLNVEQKKEETRLRDFMSGRRVRLTLRDSIWRFYRAHKHKARAASLESSIVFLNLLPRSMMMELHREIYFKPLMTNSVLSQLVHVEMMSLHRICHVAMSENTWVPSQDVFVSGMESNTAYVVTRGLLGYSTVFECHDDGECGVEVREDEWVAESTQWIKWYHSGELVAQCMCNLVELDCREFQSLIHEWGGALHRCLKKFAIFYLGQVESRIEEGAPVTDISLGRELNMNLACRAMKLSKLEKGGEVGARSSFQMLAEEAASSRPAGFPKQG